MPLLLRLRPGEPALDKDYIANWADVRSLTEVLKSTINALRQPLGMPPIGD